MKPAQSPQTRFTIPQRIVDLFPQVIAPLAPSYPQAAFEEHTGGSVTMLVLDRRNRPRFWSRALTEEELETTCFDVLMNPVRAGLCETTTGWRWSACRFERG